MLGLQEVKKLLEGNSYKLPNKQEMLTKFSEGGVEPRVFSVLDLAGAFNQLLLDEELCNFYNV